MSGGRRGAAVAAVAAAGLVAGLACQEQANGDAAPKPVRVPPPKGKLFGFSPSLFMGDVVSAKSEVRYLRAVGANAQRFTISWKGLQPNAAFTPLPDNGRPLGQLEDKGRYLARIDRLYLQLVKFRIRPIITLLGAPGWAAVSPDQCPLGQALCPPGPEGSAVPPHPSRLGEWRRFATAVAARYPRAVIEPWNEPNLVPFWHSKESGPDAALMARMQCAAYEGIKSLPGTRTVLSPGLGAHADTRPDGSPAFSDYIEQLYRGGLRECMDGLSVHMYPANDTDLGKGSPFAQQFDILRAARERHGDTSRIWVTETGSTSYPDSEQHGRGLTETAQASLNRRLYDTMMRMRDVKAVLFHMLRNPQEDYRGRELDPGLHYGFLRADWTAKPSWCVFVRRARRYRKARRIRLHGESAKCVRSRRR